MYGMYFYILVRNYLKALQELNISIIENETIIINT